MTEETLRMALSMNKNVVQKKLRDFKKYCEEYGENTTLKEVFELLKEKTKLPYKCPKCNGQGYTVREYNAYPECLPDSGWVYEPGYDYSICDLCNGVGYTKTKYVPDIETKIIGFKEET